MTYIEEDFEIEGDACTVTGAAYFDCDIDGRDLETVEFTHMMLDGYRLPASAIQSIITRVAVARIESAMGDKIQEMLNAGDFDADDIYDNWKESA